MLKARDVNKYYFSGKERIHVLKNINLEVAKGGITAVVGPSGAGKSTLLHILGGLDVPDKGEIIFDGRPLAGASDGYLSGIRNARIGFVFQFYHLLPEFNILENTMLPALINGKARIKEKALELLRSVGLGHRLKHMPAQLSGGEQQRVAVVRALINDPGLLLCDEPTGNLDTENGRQICNLIQDLNREKGMTVVLVTHNLDVAGFASKVYNIKDGYLRLQEGDNKF